MGGLRKYLRAVALLYALAAPLAARADADLPDDPVHFFATCAGRMSAVIEHQWIVDGPASEVTKARRDAVVEVLEAMMPPGDGARVMGWRVEAKAAHAALLGQVRHGPEAVRARAERRALALIAECEAFLS